MIFTALAPVAGHCFIAKDLKAACVAGDKSAAGRSGFRSVGNAYDGGICTGSIHGVIEDQGESICPPPGTTLGQEVAFVRKYLAAHPFMGGIIMSRCPQTRGSHCFGINVIGPIAMACR